MEQLLNGCYEFHYHTMPDVCARKSSDLDYAKRLQAAGMAGGVLKCHWVDTAARAALLNDLFPDMHFYGGVTLNGAAGGINPRAVECSAQMGAKMVWFPTLDARNWVKAFHKDDSSFDFSKYYSVLDDDGSLTEEAKKVLDLAEKYRLIVGTGHMSSEEGMAVVRAAKGRGIQVVLTHCENPFCCYTIEEQREAVEMGAVCEHSFYNTHVGSVPIEELVRQIQAVGCDHIIVDTDFGQVENPHSEEGLAMIAQLLIQNGLSAEDVRKMMCDNPARILQK